ncbi:hypothetical protein [Solimonas sp. SE-A11]|uniref:hypothetical protein n=1 Tax=Solimonas sp. SE-A11 TaxID=3054954 RepID=UPI00259C7D25|nr:hypothetical protein [Solimonas sp. SE-A11]MDM4770272.1 hypothetical protein [Solimonas sp. SE-A11]
MNRLAFSTAAAAFLFSGSLIAGVGTLPGASLDAPGSASVGAPAVGAPLKDIWTDSNGDGLVQKSEVKPGSQLDKRFSRRDTNGDGVLSKDEYYLP